MSFAGAPSASGFIRRFRSPFGHPVGSRYQESWGVFRSAHFWPRMVSAFLRNRFGSIRLAQGSQGVRCASQLFLLPSPPALRSLQL